MSYLYSSTPIPGVVHLSYLDFYRSMGVNEMCNFYMMFYYDATKENPFPRGAICYGNTERAVRTSFINDEMRREYPKEGTQLLPSRPDLEHHAHQSSVGFSHGLQIPFGIVEEGAFTSIGGVKLGQVAGLTFQENNLVIFHRAGRVWNQNTFDHYNVLMDKNPIKDDVILIVSITGNETRILKKLGRNKNYRFYLPHGIFMDKEGFLYTTDVGAHTVAKWRISGDDLEQVWESGVKLLPDSDRTHFCKPAGVVKTDEGVFVADGYCNSRVVQLDAETGKRMYEFGLPGNGPAQFNLPHDVVTTSTGGHLLVADRENGRVQELSNRGDFIMEWTSSCFTALGYSRIFTRQTFPMNPFTWFLDVLIVSRWGPIYVYIGRAGTGLIEYAFAPTSRPFGQPHVLRVSPDGERIFVGDIDAGRSTLWMFRVSCRHRCTAMSSKSHLLRENSMLCVCMHVVFS
ncbi:NHL repeat protein [Ancylostoma ceylanicum]|uniref:peptidylamidoglycolate lyase n=1 Tax=Ancylostoma ceylanicum TaxID=53326 RepID=A0A0D6L7U6_9BILA|nr:NHL repeat protein [Ancylostoma ceylanicum]